MPIFKTMGYRDNHCVLSIAAIFPPVPRDKPDNKSETENTFHLTVVNFKGTQNEKSCYIELNKKQLKELHTLIGEYLKTNITKEI
jgi:hypothetical protein